MDIAIINYIVTKHAKERMDVRKIPHPSTVKLRKCNKRLRRLIGQRVKKRSHEQNGVEYYYCSIGNKEAIYVLNTWAAAYPVVITTFWLTKKTRDMRKGNNKKLSVGSLHIKSIKEKEKRNCRKKYKSNN